MPDAASLQAQLDELRNLRAGGVHRLSVSDPVSERSIEYRSDAELAAAIADLERQLAAVGAGPVRMVTFSTSKGF